jgi:hypothetical protein
MDVGEVEYLCKRINSKEAVEGELMYGVRQRSACATTYPIFSGFRSKKYSATEYKVGRIGVNSFENLKKAWLRKGCSKITVYMIMNVAARPTNLLLLLPLYIFSLGVFGFLFKGGV